jgi:hypothetical protein
MAIEMRIPTIRFTLFLVGLVTVANMLSTSAVAQSNPVGSWTGVIVQKQRNIVVTLTVNNLRIGSISGDMRWGTPRACSLQTEYSGMRETQYAFNIAGSNGGWCDLYRDGSLSLEMDKMQPQSLTFRLADKQGGRLEEGKLSGSSSISRTGPATGPQRQLLSAIFPRVLELKQYRSFGSQ